MLGSYQKSWTTLRIRDIWRSVIHQKTITGRLHSALELVNLLFHVLPFEPLDNPLHRGRNQGRMNDLPKVPNWQTYNSKPKPLSPRSIFSLYTSLRKNSSNNFSWTKHLLYYSTSQLFPDEKLPRRCLTHHRSPATSWVEWNRCSAQSGIPV